jgi:hypothetical protein
MVLDVYYPPRPAFRTIVVLGGVNWAAAVRRDAILLRVFGLDKPNQESRRADSNRLPLLQLRVCLRTF